jgi:hypothetical protein
MADEQKQEYFPLTKIPLPPVSRLPGVDNSKVIRVIPRIKRETRKYDNQTILARREEREKKRQERKLKREQRRKELKGISRWFFWLWL